MASLLSVLKGLSCPSLNCTQTGDRLSSWNLLKGRGYRLSDLTSDATSVVMLQQLPHVFPTVDVPASVHYTIGAVIMAIGIIGVVGNFLVIYTFSRSRTLRTPSNMFVINLAIADFLMCITQMPCFFVNSMHKRWIFGEKGCEMYAFCGALFGICSMVTLTVIAMDRYVVITRPLTSIGVLSRKRAFIILGATWMYSLGWSLPPFFGWSAYVPEGLLTSCSWDYKTFSPSVRAYTMLLFIFVFFIPLLIIMYCYFFIFRAIRTTDTAVSSINGNNCKDFLRRFHRLRNEWKTAKISLIVILLFIISWSPYSTVALMAFAGYSNFSTPYVNSIPAVIAKASAIHNPIVYAITHPKYRLAIARYIPCLATLLCVHHKVPILNGSSVSTRQFTVTGHSSNVGSHVIRSRNSCVSSASDSDSQIGDVTEGSELRGVTKCFPNIIVTSVASSTFSCPQRSRVHGSSSRASNGSFTLGLVAMESTEVQKGSINLSIDNQMSVVED